MKKPQWILLGITGVFICLLVGIFVGRNLGGSYIRLHNSSDPQDSVVATEQNDGRLDINTATSEQLQMLPGIGETLAQRIIDYRTEHGDFKTVDELLQVNGIGESKLKQLKPYIKALN